MAIAGSIARVPPQGHGLAPAAITGIALSAFAANSLLCREALRSGAIDPVSFTSLRLASGALALSLLTRSRRPARDGVRGSRLGSAALFVYALSFALAYVHVPAGTGALLLFGAVQLTMILVGIGAGERPRTREWGGLLLASGGLAILFAPGATSPPLAGAALMVLAGMGWGAYSLLGRGSPDPLGATARQFTGALPLAAAASLAALSELSISTRGLLLALVSGALTSGVGYVVWYRALRRLTATRAALVQLAVPVIAAAGGILVLGEPVSSELFLSGAATLGGIGLALSARRQR